MKRRTTTLITKFILVFFVTTMPFSISYAQPYGTGAYGSSTYQNGTGQLSLSIATSGNVNIPIAPTSSGVLASGTNAVTVTTNDSYGYELYIRALSNTNMNSSASSIPTSANVTPLALSTNTWGYNTDASTNFVGISLTDTLIHAITIAAPGGDITNVKYGIKLDLSKPAGSYVANIVYTAVPKTN